MSEKKVFPEDVYPKDFEKWWEKESYFALRAATYKDLEKFTKDLSCAAWKDSQKQANFSFLQKVREECKKARAGCCIDINPISCTKCPFFKAKFPEDWGTDSQLTAFIEKKLEEENKAKSLV